MATISTRLPSLGKNSSNNIDDALAYKRSRDLVTDVSATMDAFTDRVFKTDNSEADFCLDKDHVIHLGLLDSNGYVNSNVDMTFDSSKSQLLRGEVRSARENFRMVSKFEQSGDGWILTRTIESKDANSPNGYQNEEEMSVQVNADGTLSMVQDQGKPPAADYYLNSIHCKSRAR